MYRLVALGCLAVACGPTPTRPTAQPATPTLPDVPFSELDLDQRAEFMKQRVVPAMAPLFRAHDAKRYAEFGCPTCHGKGATDGDFEMPNAGLPMLELSDLGRYDPADIAWMTQQIKPTMAKLLREPEHSAENPAGFGCLDCHTPKSP